MRDNLNTLSEVDLFTSDIPDDIKLAIMLHKHTKTGSDERIFAQNYLITRGLRCFVDINNESREKNNA